MLRTVFIIITLVFFSSCSNSSKFGSNYTATEESTSDVAATPPPIEPVVNDIPESTQVQEDPCKVYELKTHSQIIEFLDPGKTCDWGKNGNFPALNIGYQARHEAHVNINIPEHSYICKMNFNFPEQKIQYDDQIMMTFNNRVLLAGGSFKNAMPNDGKFMVYSWPANIKGHSYAGVYCPLKDKLSKCSLPGQEETGSAILEIDSELAQTLGLMAFKQNRYIFSFITFGDNDSTDCRHSDIRFNLDLEYVVIK